ncbi:hypothetical protein [Nocardia sp. CY41]|uniref:hypothetical protein n=1 Tax=Nocardia sp. CY41 TaxID=2608686 RepID=UPI00135C7D52|nr:hypothetical protein [Nocardia sp. CY41]
MMDAEQETTQTRRRILDRGSQLDTVITAARLRGATDAAQAAETERTALANHYRDLLPAVTIARCPSTGATVDYPIDVYDLDGWFWEYDAPIRRPPTLPATWLAMTGAMRLGEPIPDTEHRRRPGPGVPYVIPRLLNCPDVRAVLTELAIGPHTGWVITYFGPLPTGVPLENTWGTSSYSVHQNGTWLGWDSHESPLAELDFALRPWLQANRLLWIAPNDHTATLRDSLTDCPYLGLEGPHHRASIVRGNVRRYD